MHIVASISIIIHSKRIPWFHFFFFVSDVSNGINVDAKTLTQVQKSSSQWIITPLKITVFIAVTLLQFYIHVNLLILAVMGILKGELSCIDIYLVLLDPHCWAISKLPLPAISRFSVPALTCQYYLAFPGLLGLPPRPGVKKQVTMFLGLPKIGTVYGKGYILHYVRLEGL